jgi:uncharacterized protein YqgC (DUF456 family)
MSFVWLMLLIVLVIAGWLLTLFSMPGNWVIVVSAALFAWLVPADGTSGIGMSWTAVAALLILAIIGEVIEFLAGAMGASRAGGSKRGAVLAIVGSMIGALIGAFVGLPIPVVGSVVAAILFASCGALVGAMLGEWWKGRDLAQALEVGQGAFWGRMLGALAKTTVASVMAAVAIVAAVFFKSF